MARASASSARAERAAKSGPPMRRVGRPPLGAAARRLIAIRIDPQVLDAVRREAKRRGLGYQSLINNLLAKHVARVRSA
jgi:uncharacterized protein (DUF4415 family)